MNLRKRIEKLTCAALHKNPVEVEDQPNPLLIAHLVEALTGPNEYADIQEVFNAYHEETHDRP